MIFICFSSIIIPFYPASDLEVIVRKFLLGLLALIIVVLGLSSPASTGGNGGDKGISDCRTDKGEVVYRLQNRQYMLDDSPIAIKVQRGQLRIVGYMVTNQDTRFVSVALCLRPSTDSDTPVITPIMKKLKCPKGYKLNIRFSPKTKIHDDSAGNLYFHEASNVSVAYATVNGQPHLIYAQGCEATNGKTRDQLQASLDGARHTLSVVEVLLGVIFFVMIGLGWVAVHRSTDDSES